MELLNKKLDRMFHISHRIMNDTAINYHADDRIYSISNIKKWESKLKIFKCIIEESKNIQMKFSSVQIIKKDIVYPKTKKNYDYPQKKGVGTTDSLVTNLGSNLGSN